MQTLDFTAVTKAKCMCACVSVRLSVFTATEDEKGSHFISYHRPTGS